MTGGIGRYPRKSKGHMQGILDILGKLDAHGVLGFLAKSTKTVKDIKRHPWHS